MLMTQSVIKFSSKSFQFSIFDQNSFSPFQVTWFMKLLQTYSSCLCFGNLKSHHTKFQKYEF